MRKALLLQEEISNLHNKEKIIEKNFPENWGDQYSDTDPKSLEPLILKRLDQLSKPSLLSWLRRRFLGLEKFVSRHNKLLEKLCGHDEQLSEYESWLLFDEPWDEALDKAQKTSQYLLQTQKWSSCVKRCRSIEGKILQYSSSSDVTGLKIQKSNYSQKLFEKRWPNIIQDQLPEAIQAFRNYFHDIEDFHAGRHRRLERSLTALKRFFPIWITTNQSASAVMPPQAALFD